MTDRRRFLSSLLLLGAGGVVPRPAWGTRGAPRVEAQPTIFHAHPEGRLTLVRFVAHDVNAPAGRLRVYDGSRRLIGTAGVLPREGGLYGELWLPLERPTQVASELEYPGRRGPLRTGHTLRPTPRWTLYWFNVCDPAALEHALSRVPRLARGAVRAAYVEAGVALNPYAGAVAAVDHLSLIRMGEHAALIADRLGVPMSTAAVVGGAVPGTGVVQALAGAGVQVVLARDTGLGQPSWLEAPGGSRVLVLAAGGGDRSSELGFAESPDRMMERVAAALAVEPSLFPAPDPGRRAHAGRAADELRVTLVADEAPAADLGRRLTNVLEWNRRFAFPRIVPAGAETVSDLVRQARDVARLSPAGALDYLDTLALAGARDAARQTTAADALAALARLLSGRHAAPEAPEALLAVIGGEVDSVVPGALVFNPTPIVRSDVATANDGTTRVVTHVPPWGYAFVAGESAVPEETSLDAVSITSRTIEGAVGRVVLDRDSGAVASLLTPAGDDLVRAGGDGLNVVPGANLERLERVRLPGVGTRLVAERWSSAYGQVRTTLTVYDALPWLDIENRFDSGELRRTTTAEADRRASEAGVAREILFGFDAPSATVSWDAPLERRTMLAPVPRARHLRFVGLSRPFGSVYLRGLDAPEFSVMTDGTLISTASRGVVRYRVASVPGPALTDDGDRFGWGAEPLFAAACDGREGGRLPRFGSLLKLDQTGAAIVGLRPDGDDVIVYVMEQAGAGRFVSLGFGLLRFAGARLVDFVGRDRGIPAAEAPDGATFELAAWGVVAVRLTGVALGP
jgi:hypothetical protein